MKKFYRNIISILTLFMCYWSIVNAQVPYNPTTAIPYQAVARDANGNLIANHLVSLRFSLITDSTTGPVFYQETQTATTNQFGLFTVNIYAPITSTTGTFNPLAWQALAAHGAFTKVEIDVNGGSNYVNMGTTQMLYVPFALYAEAAGVTPGAVVYKGTWNAITNSPPLTSGVGTKGDFYIVSNASPNASQNTTLDGNNRYKIGDAVIYNDAVYQCLATSNIPLTAPEVPFNPASTITATNVQAALEEVENNAKDPAHINQDATHRFVSDTEKSTWNSKADKVPPASSGNLATLDATGNLVDGGKKLSDYLDKNNSSVYSPATDYNPATKKYVDDNALSSLSQVNNKVSKAGDTMTGFLILNSDPTVSLGAATKQYVDAADALKLNLSGGTLTGSLILNADPSNALGAATKQYVDAGDALKLNLSGGTLTGSLILNADPTNALGAATKRYVDTEDALKADKVVPATAGNFATLDAIGNLSDGGAKTSSNISFMPTPLLTSTNVQGAIEEVNAQFATLIDSYIHKLDDGVSIYLPPTGTIKRFGIGVTQPDARLSIKGETLNDDMMISMINAGASQKWNINLNPSPSDVPGFSIDDATSGIGTSRLFIQPSTGYVGLGTFTPQEKLHVQGNADGGDVSLQIENLASGHNGWALGHLDDNAVASRTGAFSIMEKIGATKTERITILPAITSSTNTFYNVGINESLPFATLHVTRPLSDSQRDVALAENTGILLLGPIDDKNLAFDSHQIQARTGAYVGGSTTLSFASSTLGIQPKGGGIIIHSDYTADHQVTISDEGKIGVGKTPIESVDVNGAIAIGDASSTTPANGTIRWSGTDFEGRMAGAWVSFTSSPVANDIWQQPGGPNTDLISFNPSNQGQVLHPKVGIGTTTPASTLQVEDNSQVSGSNAVTMQAISQGTLLTSTASHRIGLQLSNPTSWSSNASSLDIGIYVSNVNGQSSSSSNIAALLNGNTVIGNITGSSIVGTNGRNVLAIQTGDAPTSAAGSTTNGGIQIYTQTDAIGTSVFNVMNGDGTIIKLYRSPALTPADNSGVSATNYGTTEAGVINNLRTRINELEAKLQALGLLN